MLLVFPPGWTLSVGGPHIALPLLKGFLEARGVPVEILDLNIAITDHYKVKISESDVLRACEEPNLSSLNHPYFSAQEALNSIASRHGGHWDVQSGFSYSGFDPASSESVRCFSDEVSPFSQYFSSHVIPYTLNEAPLVVGISVAVTSQLLPSFEICRLLRKSGYRGKIVLGGNVITRLGSKLLLEWLFDLIDGFVFFQGELALFKLWEAIKNKRDLDDVPNLVWKKNGQIVSNRTESLSVTDFVGPDFSKLNLNDYWGINYLPALGSRGCYYSRCTFCAIPYGWGNGGFIGHGNSQAVFDNIKKSFYSSGINRFKFVEEALHPAVLKGVVDLINQESFICHFEGYARFDPFWSGNNFLKDAAKAGLRKVYLGLELSPSNSRKRLNKSDSAPAVETLAKLHEAGVKSHVFCMFGYPGTGIDEALSTIEFVLKHRHFIDSLDIFPFYYAKHTNVDMVEPVIDPNKDWALEYDYVSSESGVLSPCEVLELTSQLEALVWKENPIWLHPVYRMYSPWQESLRLP